LFLDWLNDDFRVGTISKKLLVLFTDGMVKKRKQHYHSIIINLLLHPKPFIKTIEQGEILCPELFSFS